MALCAAVLLSLTTHSNADKQTIDLTKNWELNWSDEFNYPNQQLDENWVSQNGLTENPWVLSSRWRENALVEDGILHLKSKKENRGGEQDWTTGNVWTKRSFHYGYYEARYKYAGAYGTNNSFWFWPKQGVPAGQKACEIDINEGHYPNIINSNIHNWTDKYTLPNGTVWHDDNQLHHTLDGKPDHTITLGKAIKTKKVRLTSTNPSSIHLSEFRVFAPSKKGYPDALAKESKIKTTNHALAEDASLTTSGVFGRMWPNLAQDTFAIDDRLDTRWVSNKGGQKFIELNWKETKKIGAIQFVNGWLQEYGASKGKYRNLMGDYKIEYHDGKEWVEIAHYNAADVADYSEEWHTYGLEWNEDYFKFYMDGELYYTMRNDVCFSETTLLFSLAILKGDIAGPVTDAIDGTSMKIDWVRYYTPKQEN